MTVNQKIIILGCSGSIFNSWKKGESLSFLGDVESQVLECLRDSYASSKDYHAEMHNGSYTDSDVIEFAIKLFEDIISEA